MPYALTLPVVAAASIVGATAVGILLGRSAIAEINPVHFQTAEETQFFADLAPNRRADWGAVQAAEYRQQAAAPAPAPPAGGCVGCATWPAGAPQVRDPQADRALRQAWREARAPAPQVRYVERIVYEDARPDPVPARVRRYAHYPVYRDEPPPPPPDWAEPADEGDAATQ
jgi:hypothetical protein